MELCSPIISLPPIIFNDWGVYNQFPHSHDPHQLKHRNFNSASKDPVKRSRAGEESLTFSVLLYLIPKFMEFWQVLFTNYGLGLLFFPGFMQMDFENLFCFEVFIGMYKHIFYHIYQNLFGCVLDILLSLAIIISKCLLSICYIKITKLNMLCEFMQFNPITIPRYYNQITWSIYRQGKQKLGEFA